MSRKFDSIEAAKIFISQATGVKQEAFQEVKDLTIGGIETTLLFDPETPQSTKDSINRQLNDTTCYKIKDVTGKEVIFGIAPFRDGFCCWYYNGNKHGFSQRL